MYMIEITEDKVHKLSEHIEQGLRHMGKAMQCVESLMEDGGMHERTKYQDGGHSRYSGGIYGGRGSMGYRDDEDWEDEDEIHERRRRNRRTGRYM